MTVNFLMEQGPTCGDPLGACSEQYVNKKCSTDNPCELDFQRYNRQEYFYSSHLQGKLLPRGYFCLKTYLNTEKWQPWIYLNRSLSHQYSKTEQVVLDQRHFLHNNGKSMYADHYYNSSEID